MSLTLGRQGGIAKPLKKRTVGQTNIAHVYDGANHIWPTSVIHFSDFTSVQLRYIWGSDDGRDLDTKSYYVNSPINNLNYVAVGWSWNLSQIPYLYWGGDNTDSGAECVINNIDNFNFDIPFIGGGNISKGIISLEVPYVNKIVALNQTDLEILKESLISLKTK